MEGPITFVANMRVINGEGKTVAVDSFERSELSYEDLVFFQGKITGVFVEMQKAAEAKAKKK